MILLEKLYVLDTTWWGLNLIEKKILQNSGKRIRIAKG